MMKDCLQLLIEPAKKLKIRLKESRKRARLEKREPLVESQLFIMELARELNRICQRSNVLGHIWTNGDSWAPKMCQDFIEEWSAVLEKTTQPSIAPTESQHERQEATDVKRSLLCALKSGGEYDIGPHKRIIMDWAQEVKSRSEPPVWPGEPVLMALDDLELQWKRGRLPSLLPAMELVMLAVLNADSPNQGDVTKEWLVRKQRSQPIDAVRYIPHNVWNWICEAAEDVTVDQDTANPALLISGDGKRLRCGPERRRVLQHPRRFDGWCCAAGARGYTSGRHYWEAEVGGSDWRLGVASAEAPRAGYRPLDAAAGYLTLRLERGTDLRALTTPATALSLTVMPRTVGVHLDCERGQLSFYDAERRAHIYTYNGDFSSGKQLIPVFGTVDVLTDLVVRPAGARQRCLCPGTCLWT